MSATTRYIILAVVLIAVGGAIFFLNDAQTGIAKKAEIALEQMPEHAQLNKDGVVDMNEMGGESIAQKEKKYPRAREIVRATGFINTENGEPVTVKEFIGKKIILIDFWTYSCINCQRTQPYLNAWQKKYADDGLLILGVHTPEFAFEEKYENVVRAVEDADIQYPVVLDNDYGTWSAYQNRYWPRKYLIDIDGFIVYDHIGEGAYEETELVIQKLLAEGAGRLGKEMSETDMSVVAPDGVEETDRTKPRTHEIYFGALRNSEYLANGEVSVAGEQTFEHSGTLIYDKLYLGGVWNITPEYARSISGGAKIILPYRAQKVFMVAGSENGAKVKIYLDGEDITSEDLGVHVNDSGTLDIQNEQLYRIVESDEYGTHILEIIVEEGSIDAFSFTFG
ncbi:MAG: thiol-disulfide isomerase [Candidatus Magasanikbacteria bacterium CG10_big_fil_rev_8_21_14_0_10_43_6]|uniref:Thiol-disulfide isomerase n=1 Tax=Candidatus Magasanikbacteria bacterium CG10_big_fil_rev_8_21_14_0_10_43_6 TaxID=1974650 RepID=A0A2M6W1I2_9BACT|nr:MAG: thiol-disulfide isomerase [Candidatus Magasanikbacteria bacterium CG10_big_fil_rev_8_21_14_0_10_43_6]